MSENLSMIKSLKKMNRITKTPMRNLMTTTKKWDMFVLEYICFMLCLFVAIIFFLCNTVLKQLRHKCTLWMQRHTVTSAASGRFALPQNRSVLGNWGGFLALQANPNSGYETANRHGHSVRCRHWLDVDDFCTQSLSGNSSDTLHSLAYDL